MNVHLVSSIFLLLEPNDEDYIQEKVLFRSLMKCPISQM